MPRRFLVHEELFGRHGTLEWRQPSSAAEYAGLRAAEIQHHVAVEVFVRLKQLEQTSGWLEERAALSTNRLSKLLRGHALLGLHDLQALEGVLGPILIGLRFDRAAVTNTAITERFDRDAARWDADF